MSVRKRRKVRKEKEKKSDPLNEFRLRFVSLLPTVKYLYETYYYSDGPINPSDGRMFFHLSDEEKISRILNNSKKQDVLMRKMNDHVKSERFTEMKKLFRETFPEVKKFPSKTTIINSLISKFHDEEPDIFKRDTEEDNLKSLKKEDLRTLQFVEFDNNVVISIDVLRIILSFLRYDSEMLYSIGCVCKGFYLSILTTWRSLVIKKSRLFGISVLVLRNLRKITFHIEGSKDGFTKRETKYICSKLSNKKLRNVDFECSLSSFHKLLRDLKEVISKGSPNPFTKVIGINFLTTDSRSLNTFNKINETCMKKKSMEIEFSKIFPSVRNFRFPFPLDLVKNLSLQSLHLNSTNPYEIYYYWRREYFDIMENIYSIGNLHRCIKNPDVLNELSIDFLYKDKNPFISQMLEYFCNVKVLSFTMDLSHAVIMDMLQPLSLDIDLSFFLKNPDITNLTFSELFGKDGKSLEGHNSHTFTIGRLRQWYTDNRSVFFFRFTRQRFGPFKASFFSSGVEKLLNLKSLTLRCPTLIDQNGILNIIINCKKLEYFRVICEIKESEEIVSDNNRWEEIITVMDRIKFVHFEIKVFCDIESSIDKYPTLIENRTGKEKPSYHRDHLLLIERDSARKTLSLGLVIVNIRLPYNLNFPIIDKLIIPNFDSLFKGIDNVYLIAREDVGIYFGGCWEKIKDIIVKEKGLIEGRGPISEFDLGSLDVNKYESEKYFIGRRYSSQNYDYVTHGEDRSEGKKCSEKKFLKWNYSKSF